MLLSWRTGGLPSDQKNKSYAYQKNIHMLRARLGDVDLQQPAVDLYNEEEYGGVYLENNTEKVWAKEGTDSLGYEIYARVLKIASGDDGAYWEWRRESHSKGTKSGKSVDIQVAYLKTIKWLEVRGNFSTINLTAKTRYKVYFLLKTEVDGKKWDVNLPVTFRLVVPQMGRQEKQQQLRITNSYARYEVGEFYNDDKTIGTIDFCMEQLHSTWKQGLAIKGVRIEPQS